MKFLRIISILFLIFVFTACQKSSDEIVPMEQADDLLSGHYVNEYDNASIDLLFLANGQVKIQGEAYWQGLNPDNIHIGNFAGWAGRNETYLIYQSGDSEFDCVVELFFQDENHFLVTDNTYCGGANVSFNGNYSLEPDQASDWSLFEEFITNP